MLYICHFSLFAKGQINSLFLKFIGDLSYDRELNQNEI